VSSYTAVDLSQLPFPDAVETLDYETILAEMLDDFHTRMTAIEPTFVPLVEGDPAYKVLEVAAYRELVIRQRVNDAIKAVCLAYAAGADLDQIGARFNVERLLIQAGDPDAVPPTDDVYESDDDYRRRIQLSFEGYSTAGPSGAYKYHALSADADVLDVSVQEHTPAAGSVTVTVLSRTGSGVPAAGVLTNVTTALNADSVRPLCDTVVVQAVTLVNYSVTATLHVYPGPDPTVVEDAAQAALDEYIANCHRVGRDVTLSGLYAALHQPGVQKVVITAPVADVAVDLDEASWCTGTTLSTVTSTDE
jgi:phage-related baseplate assembly protein